MLEFFFGFIIGGFSGICFMSACFVASCYDCQEHGPSRGE